MRYKSLSGEILDAHVQGRSSAYEMPIGAVFVNGGACDLVDKDCFADWIYSFRTDRHSYHIKILNSPDDGASWSDTAADALHREPTYSWALLPISPTAA